MIVAVSGGADSTCLLHLLLAARARHALTVEVAHFNHRLRGSRSERDAAAVGTMAARLGLGFHLAHAEPSPPRPRSSASTQEIAREARLGFLLALARRRRVIVALGHTADDQSETMAMRFVAGAGPAGLGGIPPSSHGGRLVHPLLFARRSAIERWLAGRGTTWRTDHTNRTRRYLRNRVRLDLMPLIAREYNPRIVERLGSLAEQLRRDNDFIEEHAARLLASAVTGRHCYTFSPEVLASAHPAVLSRALVGALRTLARTATDFSSRHVEALTAPGHGARSWDLPGGVSCDRDGAGLIIARRTAAARAKTPKPAVLAIPGSVALDSGFVVTACARACPSGFDPRRFGADPLRVALDRAAITPPLQIRSRRPGDRFQPLGLRAEKKLKELLIEAKIPAGRRVDVPLVCDRDGIVWVAGLRPAERCRVHGGTRQLLVLELKRAATAVRAAPPAGSGAPVPSRKRADRR